VSDVLTEPDLLRVVVAALACLVAGATAVTAVRYIAASIRNRRAPGAILARHVAEVSIGTFGLVTGYALAVYAQLGGYELVDADGRLWIYLVSMLMLLIGVVEVGNYRRQQSNPEETP
jgi:hypothetical protein